MTAKHISRRTAAALRLPTVLLAMVLITAALPAHRALAVPADPQRDHPARLKIAQAVLNIEFEPGERAVPRDLILDWITRSARTVTAYYGRFPVPSVAIRIVPAYGKGIRTGRAFGGRSPRIRVVVGRDSSAADLARDWVMVHEMIHLALPMMAGRHDWLSEGLAVYVESVARLQAGDLDEKTVWRGFVKGMEYGVPGPGDKGLDFTPTWGRKYWGGAIFCLVADLEIRKRTNGAQTLQDALRGLLAAGGDYRRYWQIRRILTAADKATGTTVMMDLYESWRDKPVDPQLRELWWRLGVRPNGRTVSFDNNAALAGVRKQIGRRHPVERMPGAG